MAMSAKHRSKFAALHRQWWRQILEWNKEKQQTNIQTNKQIESQIEQLWKTPGNEITL